MALVRDETIAFSDTAHRCLLWRRGEEQPLLVLPTGGRAICALFRPDCKHLAGLSSSGEMLWWDLSSGKLCVVTGVPRLPSIGVLVRPVYWRAKDVWAWPGSNGAIIFYWWQQRKVLEVAAHNGEFYATITCQDELLTIGRMDNRLKRWLRTEGPVDSVEAPPGVVSAALWPRDETVEVVLVDQDGGAGVYSWQEGKMELVRELDGGSFRCVIGPDFETYESAVRGRKTQRARELAARVKDTIARGDRSDLDPFYREFSELGYSQVALALQAEQARVGNDLLAELRALHLLVAMLPAREPASKDYLLRYAQLLETMWQPEKALAVCRQLQQYCPASNEYEDRTNPLVALVDAVTSEQCVIESDEPMAALIEAAIDLEAELRGRYLLRHVGAPIKCGVVVSGHDLVQRCEQTLGEGYSAPLPHAELKELWWLSKIPPCRVTLVIFPSDRSGPFSWLELGVKVFDVQLQTVLTPVVMLNAAGCGEGRSAKERNELLRGQLRLAETEPQASGWLEAVYRHVKYAIRQTVTAAWAQRI
jgi:hypothetical protein